MSGQNRPNVPFFISGNNTLLQDYWIKYLILFGLKKIKINKQNKPIK
jgi:hypothetical protein